MPQCSNCGAHVTPSYARVFTPNEVEHPRVCPDCPDRIRRQGEVVDARSQRRSGQ